MKSKVAGVLLAAALALPMGLVASSPAGAVAGTTCKKVAGIGTLKPGQPALKSTVTVKSTITVKGAKLSSCVGGGVKTGTLAASLKYGVAGNCTKTVKQIDLKIAGTITVVWNTKATSTVAKATLKPGPKGKFTSLLLSGPVSGGLFKGEKLSSLVTFALTGGQCNTKPLTSAAFTQATPFTIK